MKELLRDRWVWAAVAVAFPLRLLPLWLWGFGSTIRDESQYVNLGRAILDGKGLINPHDWLWAPAYPYLIAAFQWALPWRITLTLPPAQCLLGALTCVLMASLAHKALGDLRSARVAAWLYALHPTVAYFSGRLWCESVYGPLLIGAVWGVLWAREGTWRRAALPGLLLGLCVLMRGVATYLPPIFLLALMWPEVQQGFVDGWHARKRHVAAMCAALVLTVGPYATTASMKHGGLIISDATVGNLMFLGNNDFDPITFDYGNGVLRFSARGAHTKLGRKPCPHSGPVEWNACETRRGMEWIRANPGEFVRRMPVRVAQLVNPNSFLTRSIRWGKYKGLPWAVREGLVAWVAFWSFLVMVAGTMGAAARARGPYAWMAIGTVTYTVAASAALYGLTRFRVPIEPLWMIYAAGVLAHPVQTLQLLRQEMVRLVLALIWVPLLVGHMLWFLPSGWPGLNW
jgi:hypothetical protein